MADHHSVCPYWVGYLMLFPLRKLVYNPNKIVGPYIDYGMKVMDVGCAMGFFSLPMAKMVGKEGRVFCLDIQEKMLNKVEKRAQKKGLDKRVETIQAREKSLNMNQHKDSIDFALAFAVLHEVPDQSIFLASIHESLKPTAKLMVAEPKGHVTGDDFIKSIMIAEAIGFGVMARPYIYKSHAVLFEKLG